MNKWMKMLIQKSKYADNGKCAIAHVQAVEIIIIHIYTISQYLICKMIKKTHYIWSFFLCCFMDLLLAVGSTDNSTY